jgi:hypothetical protein
LEDSRSDLQNVCVEVINQLYAKAKELKGDMKVRIAQSEFCQKLGDPLMNKSVAFRLLESELDMHVCFTSCTAQRGVQARCHFLTSDEGVPVSAKCFVVDFTQAIDPPLQPDFDVCD